MGRHGLRQVLALETQESGLAKAVALKRTQKNG